MMKFFKLISIFVFACITIPALLNAESFLEVLNVDSRDTVSLAGKWDLALQDDQPIGNSKMLPPLHFEDRVKLPGSLAENQAGVRNTNRKETRYLSREYMFEGTAWYRKTIRIPNDWAGQRVTLRMERSRKTAVWVDGQSFGSQDSLCASHVYDFASLQPGKHELIVAVDNVREGAPHGRSHMNVEDTQTNWNGILGKLQLEATPFVWVENVRIFSDVMGQQARVELTLRNGKSQSKRGKIVVAANSFNSSSKHCPESVEIPFEIQSDEANKTLIAKIDMGADQQLWDEFAPALYRAKITLILEDEGEQQLGRTFGMREFQQNGSQFVINGKTIFLRGKHDACVFPLTGYAPMDVAAWVRILTIAKSYGINHYRFHTWTPPEAALAAADLVGIYMQPELPSWGELDAQERAVKFDDINAVAFGAEKTGKGEVFDPRIVTRSEAYFHEESKRILNEFGDHASFVMFALGNELKGNRDVMQRLVDGCRTLDGDRRLYAQGSNNHFRDPIVGATDDYFTTVRTSTKTWEQLDNITRTSYFFGDQKGGGPINAWRPSTRVNFTKALANTKVPVIGHETGQYLYYPDYEEIKKYTGVTKAWNFEVAREGLKTSGMWDQRKDFFHAAGRWASILYCEDMESGIRTPGFGGFQLLDLQDFPGQGTALVGPLNAFMESKGTIAPEKWREFCDPVTILAEFDAFTLAGGDRFVAELKIANYGSGALNGKRLNWNIEGVGCGEVAVSAAQGGLTQVGEIRVALPKVEHAIRSNLNLKIDGTGIVKSYPLWIYPSNKKIEVPESVTVSRTLDPKTLAVLDSGGRVLLIPEHDAIEKNSVSGLFMTEFWSYAMFSEIAKRKGIEPSPGTLGLLIEENHPALAGFPTEFHSNWQWWALVKNSRPILLDHAPKGYKPLIQTIDNMWTNRKMGTLFEFQVGKGRVLVSAIDLPTIEDMVEAAALYRSLLDYCASKAFDPETKIETRDLKTILGE